MNSNNQIVSYSLKLPKTLLTDFRVRVRTEGYSIQDALILLMDQYIKETGHN